MLNKVSFLTSTCDDDDDDDDMVAWLGVELTSHVDTVSVGTKSTKNVAASTAVPSSCYIDDIRQ